MDVQNMKLTIQKKELRKLIAEKVKALPKAYCEQADQSILEHILLLPAFQQAHTVFCFIGRENEINTWPMIEAAWQLGKRVGVPRCISMGIMEVYQIASVDDIEEGKYGIKEPKPACALIAPSQIDFAVIPCLSCNKEGYRLGYGGGFYDRYLARMSCQSAVICRERILYPDIPVEQFDQKVDLVVTENGLS